MSVSAVYNTGKEKVGEVELNESLFGLAVKTHILHDIVKMQLANRRAGTACTKTRGEVKGSGAKPYRQKGTGRARAGTKKSPLWRSGGTVFGPKPRDYSIKLPKKLKRLGLCMALSARFSEENLLVLDEFQMEEIKTKSFLDVMKVLEIDNCLIVVPEKDKNLEKSSSNAPGFKVLPVEGLNVYDVLHHHQLVVLKSSLDKLEERLLP